MTQISIWTPKGGVGKTMLALQLAASFAKDNARVLVVDHDPQAGALIFSRIAQQQNHTLPFVVSNAMCQGFDITIHDFSPAMVEDLPSRIVVMPTLLDAASFLLFTRGKAVAQELGKVVIPVGTRYRADRAEQRALAISHFDSGLVVKDRAVYANAFGKGQSVYDSHMAYAQHAQAEINAVASAIKDIIQPARRAA